MDYVVNFDLSRILFHTLYSSVHIHIKGNIQDARQHYSQCKIIGT